MTEFLSFSYLSAISSIDFVVSAVMFGMSHISTYKTCMLSVGTKIYYLKLTIFFYFFDDWKTSWHRHFIIATHWKYWSRCAGEIDSLIVNRSNRIIVLRNSGTEVTDRQVDFSMKLWRWWMVSLKIYTFFYLYRQASRQKCHTNVTRHVLGPTDVDCLFTALT